MATLLFYRVAIFLFLKSKNTRSNTLEFFTMPLYQALGPFLFLLNTQLWFYSSSVFDIVFAVQFKSILKEFILILKLSKKPSYQAFNNLT